MATRTRPKRNAASKRYNEDWEQTPLTKSKTDEKESPAQKKSANSKVSPVKRGSTASNKSKVASTQKNSKQKKDTHAFSSYFESKRGTVQYNYHISPVAKICVGSPQKPKLKVHRKRKGDVFDFCSDDEDMNIPSKKPKVSSANLKNVSKADTKKATSSTYKPSGKQLSTSPKKRKQETSPKTKTAKKTSLPKSGQSPRKKSDVLEGGKGTQVRSNSVHHGKIRYNSISFFFLHRLQ